MKFDAIEQKSKNKKPRKVRKGIARLTKVYPVAGTKNEHTVKLRYEEKKFLHIFRYKKYDLELLDEKRILSQRIMEFSPSICKFIERNIYEFSRR